MNALPFIFMQTQAISDEAALGLFAAFAMFFFILAIIVYLYSSFAYMAIAKKAKYPSPGIAWIPLVGPAIITAKTAQMHWWPILLLIGVFIPFIGGLFSLAFAVFSIIWLFKTYEKIGKPGWWAIMMIIPIVGLVFLGIAAWSKN
jgi:uncharacterized membrane protein YhaH (DUF805 family)